VTYLYLYYLIQNDTPKLSSFKVINDQARPYQYHYDYNYKFKLDAISIIILRVVARLCRGVTSQYSEGPLLRRSIIPKVHYSEGALFRRCISPKVH